MSTMGVGLDLDGTACDTRIPWTHGSHPTEIVALSAFSKAGFAATREFTHETPEAT